MTTGENDLEDVGGIVGTDSNFIYEPTKSLPIISR
jgi:hypothetical protein